MQVTFNQGSYGISSNTQYHGPAKEQLVPLLHGGVHMARRRLKAEVIAAENNNVVFFI